MVQLSGKYLFACQRTAMTLDSGGRIEELLRYEEEVEDEEVLLYLVVLLREITRRRDDWNQIPEN